MTWLAVGISAASLFLALASYASFLAARYFFVPRFPDEIHFATTSRRLAGGASCATAPDNGRPPHRAGAAGPRHRRQSL